MSGTQTGRDWAVGGGVAVILATGFAALGDGSLVGGGSRFNLVLAALIAVLTIGGAVALSRFIARHGDEIGEARFDTRNKDVSGPDAD